jgi:hypothetical protein
MPGRGLARQVRPSRIGALLLALLGPACSSDYHPAVNQAAVQTMPVELAMHFVDEAMKQPGWSSEPKAPLGITVTMSAHPDVCMMKVGDFTRYPVRLRDVTDIVYTPADPKLNMHDGILAVSFGSHCNNVLLLGDISPQMALDVTTALHVLADADRQGKLPRSAPIAVRDAGGELAGLEDALIEHQVDATFHERTLAYLLRASGPSLATGTAGVAGGTPAAAPQPGNSWRLHGSYTSLTAGAGVPGIMPMDDSFQVVSSGQVRSIQSLTAPSVSGDLRTTVTSMLNLTAVLPNDPFREFLSDETTSSTDSTSPAGGSHGESHARLLSVSGNPAGLFPLRTGNVIDVSAKLTSSGTVTSNYSGESTNIQTTGQTTMRKTCRVGDPGTVALPGRVVATFEIRCVLLSVTDATAIVSTTGQQPSGSVSVVIEDYQYAPALGMTVRKTSVTGYPGSSGLRTKLFEELAEISWH